MGNAGYALSNEEVDQIFKNIKFISSSEGITYSEFLCVCLKSYPVQRATLKKLFRYFDASQSNKISPDDIVAIFTRMMVDSISQFELFEAFTDLT
mmetsp:Transcript_11591/g.10107  ORF Transcript_11591/g.10107 Transcript_11591/m.10107 type:complete len:95 (+) Transcript_11591:1242-1526(+)